MSFHKNKNSNAIQIGDRVITTHTSHTKKWDKRRKINALAA